MSRDMERPAEPARSPTVGRHMKKNVAGLCSMKKVQANVGSLCGASEQ